LNQFNEEYNIRSSINLRLKGELLRIGSQREKKNKRKSEGKSYKQLLHQSRDFIKGKNKKKSKADKNGKKKCWILFI